MQIKKEQIPWAMAAGRALLGPVVLAGEACGWSGMALAGTVVTALLSDIFDGVLARRWRCDTPGVRLFDSMADTAFYVCVGIGLWIGQSQIWREDAGLLVALLIAEAMNFGLAFAKFGKPASYHSYLAKVWGLVLATAVVAAFASGRGSPLIPAALMLGIVCNLQGLAMSWMLPVWRKDVKTLRVAWQMRAEMRGKTGIVAQATRNQQSRPAPATRTRLAPVAASMVALCLLAAPAYALGPGKAAYVNGTAALARDTIGSFDTTSPTILRFQYKEPSGAAGQIGIDYAKIYTVEPTEEPVHRLGVLPWIAVSLVAHPETRYLITIRYADADGTAQIGVFEVARRDQHVVVEIVNARSTRACGARTYPCPATLERR
jgi:CDP-diacylglycerol--glycerol-3-phosphate 3-phosphatidyltransferase